MGQSSGMEAVNALNAYQQAVNTAAIVSITDKKGTIIYVNDLFCEISKYSREELIGQNHRIINSGYHPRSFFSNLWNTISSGSIWHGEVKNKAKDGTFYWVDTTISPVLDNERKITHYLSIRSLISERKRLEKERERLLSELTQKYNDLMQFNYIVSHNLRAPIANILGLVDIVSHELEVEEELIELIRQSANAMDSVVSDLTRILAIRNPINESLENISVPDLLSIVENSLSTQISDSGAVLRKRVSTEASNLRSIKPYFQSIFYNLISNAIKYRNEKLAPLIVIKADRFDKTLLITIEDNGCGMDLEVIGDKLFGLYQRFNLERKGQGLGLYLVKTQVEALGGRITVESKPGEGTTFTLTFPSMF